MKKIVSSTRVTSARRKPAARAAARLPAPRFQSRGRRQDNRGLRPAYQRRPLAQLSARNRKTGAEEVLAGDVGMLRMPALRRQYPRSRSTIYGDIRAGRFTPPVALGPRCSAWPAHEVDQILAARAAGASDRQIRQLVTRLVAERSTCR